MIAVTSNVLKILQVYRVFLAALGLTWVAVAIGVIRSLNVIQAGLNAFQNYYEAFLIVFLFYLVYASFYGVYRLSRQISEYNTVSTVIVKLQTETFLAVMINVGISSVIVDHLVEMYGIQVHAVVLIIMLIAASSFTRHPFLKRFVNFFRRRIVKEYEDYTFSPENK